MVGVSSVTAALVGVLATASAAPSPSPLARPTVMSDTQRQALAELQSNAGPVRFGVVVPGRLCRGGQPDVHQIELLHRFGVDTIIDLRRGDTDEEAAAAQRLGMRFLRFPFYGTFGADREFLLAIIDAVATSGHTYVHCHAGRDRTSLVVALYRVLVDGWNPQRAWQEEAVAYGHKPGLFYRAISRSFNAVIKTLPGTHP